MRSGPSTRTGPEALGDLGRGSAAVIETVCGTGAYRCPRPQGLRVCCPKQPEWGRGSVLADDGGAMVTVFILAGGKRTLDTTIADLALVTGPAAAHPIPDLAAQANWQHAHHNSCTREEPFRPPGPERGCVLTSSAQEKPSATPRISEWRWAGWWAAQDSNLRPAD